MWRISSLISKRGSANRSLMAFAIVNLDNAEKSIVDKLRDANGWLDYVLEDFMDGKTQSVSGEQNAQRLIAARDILDKLELELKQLEEIVVGKDATQKSQNVNEG